METESKLLKQVGIPYWRLSGFYFFYFATLGGFLPYWSLYLEGTGFNPLEIGELSALLVGTKIIAPNIWGWIADHTGKSLRIIRIASFLAALLFAGFLLDQSYYWFAWVTVTFSFFWNAALPQFEAATLFHLQKESHRYSQIRLWGSVGFIVSVLSVGYLLDYQDISVLPNIIVASLLSIWLITLVTPEVKKSHYPGNPVSILQILKKPEVIAFFVVYMLLQMAHAPYYVFFSIYLSENGYSSTIIGLLWSLGVFAEILLFLVMRQLLRRFSLRNILLLGIFLSVLRWLVIAWGVHYLWLLLLAQLLHAATFGVTHITAIHMVYRYFGLQHQGKGQAMYSSLSFGLGGMLGSLFSGFYWELYGPQIVYSAAAIICLLAFVIAVFGIGRKNSVTC